jgi:hypothetical protein
MGSTLVHTRTRIAEHKFHWSSVPLDRRQFLKDDLVHRDSSSPADLAFGDENRPSQLLPVLPENLIRRPGLHLAILKTDLRSNVLFKAAVVDDHRERCGCPSYFKLVLELSSWPVPSKLLPATRGIQKTAGTRKNAYPTET